MTAPQTGQADYMPMKRTSSAIRTSSASQQPAHDWHIRQTADPGQPPPRMAERFGSLGTAAEAKSSRALTGNQPLAGSIPAEIASLDQSCLMGGTYLEPHLFGTYLHRTSHVWWVAPICTALICTAQI